VRQVAPRAAFLGVDVETDLTRLAADYAIVGVPHGVPYPHATVTAACADAPDAIRARSQRLARFRGHWDFDLDGPMLAADASDARRIVDAGDVPGGPADGPGNATRAEAAIRAVLTAGAVPVVLGGDDSVPIPVLRALADHGPLTVVQVDAHLDFRDEVDGIRVGYSSAMRRAAEMAHVERIVQVGLRGVGSARADDVADARAAGNVLVTARELRRRGVPWLVGEVPQGASVFLAFDFDALDPTTFPAVSAPAPGGLTWDEASELVAGLARRARLVGAAFTEYRPDLDPTGLSALVAARLIVRLLAG
jgi:agmatinase